jgi:hypothetical protein
MQVLQVLFVQEREEASRWLLAVDRIARVDHWQARPARQIVLEEEWVSWNPG